MKLFEDLPPLGEPPLLLAPGAFLLRGFALDEERELLPALERVITLAPLRHMVTRGGSTMSAAMTNRGELGWVSDRRGYRYSPVDPLTAE